MFALLPILNESAQFNPGEFATALGFITMLMAIGVISSRTVLEERAHRTRSEELRADLEEAHRQLKAYSEQALATGQERNHMAREIHDGLGHYLAAINVQLEKAIAFRERDSKVADQALGEAKRLTGEALQDVRSSMGMLRAAQQTLPLPAALERLVSNFSDGRVQIELTIEGQEAGFSKQALAALYRAAQEGLTNIRKHAGASHAVVNLHFRESEASLELSDNGRGFDTTVLHRAHGTGEGRYGLQSMRERLELVGGSFALQSSPGVGTRLRVSVPKDPLALAGGHPLARKGEL
jgi:signal transduction histidine kinase